MNASTLLRRLFLGSTISAVIAVLIVGSGPLSAHATIGDKDNDFNNDGASDLLAVEGATPNFDYCLTRWNGNGSGSLLPGATVGCNWFPFSGQMATPGDLNSDGNADLVAINRGTGCQFMWLGTGAGTFSSGTQLSCNWTGYSTSLVGAGDLDNDGDGDLVAVNGTTGCMYRWRGNGVGGFAPGVLIGCGWASYMHRLVAPGDINSDGNADLVAVDFSTGCMFRWLGDGSGSIGAGTQLGCGWDDITHPVGMGDMNGDGDGDIVGRNNSNDCMYRWLGTGAGTFANGATLGCTGWGNYFLAR